MEFQFIMAMVRNLKWCLNETNYCLYCLNRLRLCRELQRESKNFQFKYLSTTDKNLSQKTQRPFKEIVRNDGEKVMKKVHSTPKILLHDLDGKVNSVYFEEAKKLAEHRGLELLQLQSQGKKPTYKLVKETQIYETLDSATNANKEKIHKFIINSSISDHDLEVKKKQIMKLLKKGKVIEVTILDKTSNEAANKLADEILKAFEPEYKITSKSFKKGYKMYIYSSEENNTKVCDEKMDKENFEQT